MDFQTLMLKRYSCRAYTNQPVEAEKLQLVLEAARVAPTAANRQPFRVLVIHTAGREDELRRIYNKDWFVQAPIILAVCGVPEEAWKRRADDWSAMDVDAAIVMDHMILMATELGLGTCWIAAFDPQAAREVLQLPDSLVPLLFTPLGYPADQPRAKVRESLEDLVRYERWS